MERLTTYVIVRELFNGIWFVLASFLAFATCRYYLMERRDARNGADRAALDAAIAIGCLSVGGVLRALGVWVTLKAQIIGADVSGYVIWLWGLLFISLTFMVIGSFLCIRVFSSRYCGSWTWRAAVIGCVVFGAFDVLTDWWWS